MDTFLREEKRKYDTNEMVLGISQKVPLQASGRPDPDDFHFRSRHRKPLRFRYDRRWCHSGRSVWPTLEACSHPAFSYAGPRCPAFLLSGYFRSMLAGRALRHAGRCLPPPSDRGLRLLQQEKNRRSDEPSNRRHGSNPPLRCLHYLSGLRKYPAVLLCALHDLYGKCEAGALHADRSALYSHHHSKTVQRGSTDIPAHPRLLFFPECLRSGKCQRQPCRKSLCQGRLWNWKI